MDGPVGESSDAVSTASALACIASALGVGTRGMDPGTRELVLVETDRE